MENSLKVVLEGLPRNILSHSIAELEGMLRAIHRKALTVWWMAFYCQSLQVDSLGLEDFGDVFSGWLFRMRPHSCTRDSWS